MANQDRAEWRAALRNSVLGPPFEVVDVSVVGDRDDARDEMLNSGICSGAVGDDCCHGDCEAEQ